MANHPEQRSFTVKCPNCKKTVEPDHNETTNRYVCPICAAHVDAQVLIERKKRGDKFRPPGSIGMTGREE